MEQTLAKSGYCLLDIFQAGIEVVQPCTPPIKNYRRLRMKVHGFFKQAVEVLVAAGADLTWTDSKGRDARAQAARRAGVLYAIDRGLERLGQPLEIASAARTTRSAAPSSMRPSGC